MALTSSTIRLLSGIRFGSILTSLAPRICNEKGPDCEVGAKYREGRKTPSGQLGLGGPRMALFVLGVTFDLIFQPTNGTAHRGHHQTEIADFLGRNPGMFAHCR